jgi:sec-independent protein translocase protein TatC
MVTAQQLVEKRRFVIVAAFVAAAIVTPPDVMSQLTLALALLGLHEAVVAFLRWMEGRS